jgi:hypothetical protein
MIDTNTLLSIGFSLLAQFTNVVRLPTDVVPQQPGHLQRYLIGTPNSPIDLFLAHSGGTSFLISHGIVQRVLSPKSFFHLQDPKSLNKFIGEPVLSLTQITNIAVTVVKRLANHNPHFLQQVPVIKCGPTLAQGTVPFYQIHWPVDQNTSFAYAAKVEIDARRGEIVFLDLRDPVFYNETYEINISNRVYKGLVGKVLTSNTLRSLKEPASSLLSSNTLAMERPSATRVATAITNWLDVCRRLKIQPGPDTNLADVDWSRTCLYRYARISTDQLICRTCFSNGTQFDSLDGYVLNHASSDQYYVGNWQWKSTNEEKQFYGTNVYRWQALVVDFERCLNDEFGVLQSDLSSYKAVPSIGLTDVGSVGRTRVQVEWCPWRYGAKRLPAESSRPVLIVEFDLQTGQVKGYGFRDSKLFEIFARGQRINSEASHEGPIKQ